MKHGQLWRLAVVVLSTAWSGAACTGFVSPRTLDSGLLPDGPRDGRFPGDRAVSPKDLSSFDGPPRDRSAPTDGPSVTQDGPGLTTVTVILHQGVAGYAGLSTASLVNGCADKTSSPCANNKMRVDNDWTGSLPNHQTYQEGLIRFAGLPALPVGGKVESATLSLWSYPGHPCRPISKDHPKTDCPSTFEVYAMARTWTPAATWLSDGLGKSWGQNGALQPQVDYLPALMSSTVIEPPCSCLTCFSCPCSDFKNADGYPYGGSCMTPYTCYDASQPLQGSHAFDITTIVQAWMSGQLSNHGLVLRSRHGGSWPAYPGCNPFVEYYFAGMDYVAPGSPKKNLLPRLEITYSQP